MFLLSETYPSAANVVASAVIEATLKKSGDDNDDDAEEEEEEEVEAAARRGSSSSVLMRSKLCRSSRDMFAYTCVFFIKYKQLNACLLTRSERFFLLLLFSVARAFSI
jgi:hypothetical protein